MLHGTPWHSGSLVIHECFCHLRLCYSCEPDDWNWTVCLAAGQLSWTISVVTGLWSLLSPVFTMKTLSSCGAAVFCKLYPLWSISCSPFLGANCSKSCSCSVPGVVSYEKPGAPHIYWLFFPFSSSCLLCPLLVGVRAPHWCFFPEENGRCCLLLFGSVSVSTSHFVWCHLRWLVPAICRSQPVHLQVTSLIATWLLFFYPHFTMETNTVSPQMPQLCRYLRRWTLFPKWHSRTDRRYLGNLCH